MTSRALLVGSAIAALALGGWFVWAEEAPQPVPPPVAEVPAPTPRDDMAAGKSLVERGADMFLRGLLQEMAPEIEDMHKGLGEAADKLGPKLREILALIDDVRNYQAPERLPNGDIVIRRLPGAPKPPPLPAPDDRAKPRMPGPVTDL
ncbi:AAA+ family ATPase [Rhodobacter capsulatus]|uniref:AAA+ family ATPase n=1 Tax=Rhodobacter capsulatus TaxID=1061 RepID=UPI004027219C